MPRRSRCHHLPPLTELPPPNPTRWSARRKEVVARFVRDGMIGVDEACRLYSLSVEELRSWQRALSQPGMHVVRSPQHRGDLDEAAE
jgi:uncharacterized protein DUF1153